MVRESPPWLFGAIVHISVLIVLGLLLLHPQVQPNLLLEVGYSEKLGDAIDEPLDEISNDDFKSTRVC